MNKKKIFYISALAIFTCLIIIICMYSFFKTNKNVLKVHKELQNVRNDFKNEFLNYSFNNNCPRFHHVAQIRNKAGSCYFSTIIQTFCANKHVVEAIIMSDFDETHVFSRVFQYIMCEYFTLNKIDISMELKCLREITNNVNFFSEDKGGIVDLHYELIYRVIELEINRSNNLAKYKEIFMHDLKLQYNVECKKCNKKEQINQNSYLLKINIDEYKNIILLNDIDSLQKKIDVHIKCGLHYSNIQIKCNEMPQNLFIYLQNIEWPFRFTHKLTKVLLNITLENTAYQLVSIICAIKVQNVGHGIVYVRKGDKWVYCSDEIINRVDIMTEF